MAAMRNPTTISSGSGRYRLVFLVLFAHDWQRRFAATWIFFGWSIRMGLGTPHSGQGMSSVLVGMGGLPEIEYPLVEPAGAYLGVLLFDLHTDR
jgi:hypothetical protein